MYVAKTDWQNHIDTILASGQPLTAALLRQFHTDMLDSWVHLDDAGGGGSSTLYPMVAYVNGDNGDDATAVVGDINLPYSTIEAAVAAVSGTWPLVMVYPCSSGYNVAATITKSSSVRIYFMPNTRVITSITGPMFKLEGNNYFHVLGHGRFGHFGTGDVFLDNGLQTTGTTIFEFDDIWAGGGKCIHVNDVLGASNGKLMVIKGNTCSSSGSQAIKCAGWRSYKIDIAFVSSSNSYAAWFDFTEDSSLDFKAFLVQSTVTSAIYYTYDRPTNARFDIHSISYNFFSGVGYKFFTSGTSDPAFVSIINGSVMTSVESNESIIITCSGVTFYAVSIGPESLADVASSSIIYVDGIRSVLYSKFFGKAEVANAGRIVFNGDLLIHNGSEPLVLISDGGTFSLNGLIENLGPQDCIECNGADTYLEVMPGSRIKATSGNYPINISSGTCHYKALGSHYVNRAINGTPSFDVGSGTDIIVNSSI